MYSDHRNHRNLPPGGKPPTPPRELLSHSIKFVVWHSPRCKPSRQQRSVSQQHNPSMSELQCVIYLLDTLNAELSPCPADGDKDVPPLKSRLYLDWFGPTGVSAGSFPVQHVNVNWDFVGQLAKKKHTFTQLKAKCPLKPVPVPKIAPTPSCSVTGPP